MTTHVQEWQECSVCGWYTGIVNGKVQHLGRATFTHAPRPQEIRPEPARCQGCSHVRHGAGECQAQPLFMKGARCRCTEGEP